jgi:hypothetical protein
VTIQIHKGLADNGGIFMLQLLEKEIWIIFNSGKQMTIYSVDGKEWNILALLPNFYSLQLVFQNWNNIQLAFGVNPN